MHVKSYSVMAIINDTVGVGKTSLLRKSNSQIILQDFRQLFRLTSEAGQRYIVQVVAAC